jgi:hypothetical protein
MKTFVLVSASSAGHPDYQCTKWEGKAPEMLTKSESDEKDTDYLVAGV